MKMCRVILCVLGIAMVAPLSLQGQTPLLDALRDGRADMQKADFNTAIADFTRAIQASPTSFDAYNQRGFARLHNFDLNGAMADFTQAITLHDDTNNSHYGRALVEQANGDFKSAMSDYILVIQTAHKPESTDYPHFFLWLVRTQLGQKDEADKELADYMTKRPSSAPWWDTDICKYLLGQFSDTDLLTTAVSVKTADWRDHFQCEAWYFVGMKKLIAGDKAAASDYFRKSESTNQPRLTEAILARAEFEALQLNP